MTGNDPRQGPSPDRERSQVENDLRRSLARHAAQSPTDDIAGLVAERILHAADRQGPSQPHSPTGRIRWAAPAAAAAVLVVLAGVIVAIAHFRSANSNQVAGRHLSGARTAVLTPSAPPTSTSHSPNGRTSPAVVPPPAHPMLTGVRILDLTFDRLDDGWALGTADCAAGTCLAVFHTSDGSTWQSEGGDFGFNVPGVTAGCSDKCVQHIRFATEKVGYAYGPSAFFMTTDGGEKWKQQPGGADYLESAGGNVVRVHETGTGCPAFCGVQVSVSAIGGSTWTASSLSPSFSHGDGLQLVRSGADVYLLVTQNPASGAGHQQSTLYASDDNGAHFLSRGEPCPQGDNPNADGEVDTISIAANVNGAVTALCSPRGSANHSEFLALSGDASASPFERTLDPLPADAGNQLNGDPSTTVLITGNFADATSYRWNRTGRWVAVPPLRGPVTFAGFESTTVGRVVTRGDTIWTTRDRGISWTAYHFN